MLIEYQGSDGTRRIVRLIKSKIPPRLLAPGRRGLNPGERLTEVAYFIKTSHQGSILARIISDPAGDLVLGVSYFGATKTSNVFKGWTLLKVAFKFLPGFNRP